MKFTPHPAVKEMISNYPKVIEKQLLQLRELIVKTAKETEGVNELEETLKWGEPSYVTKHGSTLRIDWKEKTPDQFAMYFQCTSRLVPTFKTIYKNKLQFEGSRAILFKKDKKIPVEETKHCIALALTYHKVKNLPLLGA